MTNEEKATQKLDLAMQSYKVALDSKMQEFQLQYLDLFTAETKKNFDPLIRCEQLDKLIEAFRWDIWHGWRDIEEQGNQLEELREGINTKSE